MAEVIDDTGKHKKHNGNAWERYVKWFRSNTEAEEQFIAHEKLVDRMRGEKVGESNGTSSKHMGKS